METLRITQAALDALPEYSCSLPTGTTIGKRWRCANDYHDQSKGYLIGEYVPHDDPEKIGIKWWQPEISYEPDAIRRPVELFFERAQNWALGICGGEDEAEMRAGFAAMLDDWLDELTIKYHRVLTKQPPVRSQAS